MGVNNFNVCKQIKNNDYCKQEKNKIHWVDFDSKASLGCFDSLTVNNECKQL